MNFTVSVSVNTTVMSLQCHWDVTIAVCYFIAKLLDVSLLYVRTVLSLNISTTTPHAHTHTHTHTLRTHVAHLSILIVQSQQLMRRFAADHLMETCGYNTDMAKKLAHSCVSQRDIQVCGCVFRYLLHPMFPSCLCFTVHVSVHQFICNGFFIINCLLLLIYQVSVATIAVSFSVPCSLPVASLHLV